MSINRQYVRTVEESKISATNDGVKNRSYKLCEEVC